MTSVRVQFKFSSLQPSFGDIISVNVTQRQPRPSVTAYRGDGYGVAEEASSPKKLLEEGQTYILAPP